MRFRRKILAASLKASMAALLLSTSATALFAADDPVLKEIAALKAQVDAQKAEIDQLNAAVKDQKTETRKNKEAIKVAVDRPLPPVAPYKAPVAFNDKSWMWGAVKITPGGYIAADGVFRTRDANSDMGTSFTGIPTLNNPLAHMNEQRFSARGTRLSALLEAPVDPSTLLSGFFEMDFQGGGTTSNYTQTDSFAPRIRNAYASLDYLDSGWHFLAGQSWSLVTLNSGGITPRQEAVPIVIDSNDVPGFAYARQPRIRITKDFDKNIWFAISAEQSATTCGGTGCNNAVANSSALPAASATNFGAATGVSGISCLATGSSGFGQTGQNQTAAGFAGGSTNQSADGYGVGGGIVAAIIPKLLEFEASGLVGKGMGRYGSTNLLDATLSTNGAIVPLKNVDIFGGFVLHATPKIDAYLFSGIEKVDAAYGFGGATASNPSGYIGYGAPTLVNTGCNIEGGTCTGVTGAIWQVTGGLWDRSIKDPTAISVLDFNIPITDVNSWPAQVGSKARLTTTSS